MTGLLICAALAGWLLAAGADEWLKGGKWLAMGLFACALGLALIAAALYLAWRAGGAGA